MKKGLKSPQNEQFYKKFVNQISEMKKDGAELYGKSCFDLIQNLNTKYCK